MKKLFTLTMLALLLAVGANAQDKKTWAFQEKGLSDATKANLEADANWTLDGTDSWYDASKSVLSGELMANGEPIAEMQGITIGTAGLSSSKNIYIRADRFRVNRDKMTFNLPQLKNGQTITIVCQSANGTATNRGVKASYDYMRRIEGPENNLIPGPDGLITNKWQVVTDSSDPVDIQFTLIEGGIDFRLIMIDEGDAPVIVKTAYLYDGTNDDVLAFLQGDETYEVTPININTETITAESLQDYDVTIISASVSADNAVVATLKEALPWTPVVNLNGSLYDVWGYGEAIPTEAWSLLVSNTKHDLVKGIELEEEEDGKLLPMGSNITGVSLGDYFKNDAVPLRPYEYEDVVGVHVHNNGHNSYIYIPFTDEPSDEAYQLLANAITLAANSKANITAAAAPKLALEYKNLNTNITITAPSLPKAEVFYTLDGSTPTVESTKYTAPINVTTETTVKAVAIAEGYTISNVAEILADIKSQPKTPIISYEEQGAQTTITITPGEEYGDDDNVKIYYNFEESVITDTLKSTVYADSIPVVITMPQYVTAFAVKDGLVWSEVARQRVLVKEPRVVIDVAAHYSAPQWTADNNPEGKSVDNNKGMFTWGASAATMYTGEGTSGFDPETGEETTIYGDEDLRPYEIVNEPGENPEWVFKSRGTCLVWQNIGAQTTNFGDDSNYNPMYSTDVDPLFPVTKNDIQFYKFIANETPNASIETLKKYQAPLDIVVLANMAGGPLVAQVSVDGESWQTVGEIAKTGKTRMWNKSTISYDGTDEVFVRITEEVASAGPKVFDIYIANQGEKSKELLQQLQDEITGIKDVQQQKTQVAAGIYNLNGARQNGLQRGLNIVVEADGTVKKVVVK